MSEFVSFVSYSGDAERRERVLRQKRLRYRNDLAHRSAKQEAAKARYKPVQKPVERKRGRNKPRVHALPSGRLVLLLGLGELADLCGLSKQVICRYEKAGVIPLNRIVDGAGRRWYPKPFAEWLASLLQNQSRLREPLWRLKRRVEQAWSKAGENIPVLKEAQ